MGAYSQLCTPLQFDIDGPAREVEEQTSRGTPN
jgi:hypothetical protein